MFLDQLRPAHPKFKEEIDTEVAFSQRILQSNKEALSKFVEHAQQKKHQLACSVEETSHINNRFEYDLGDIRQQLVDFKNI